MIVHIILFKMTISMNLLLFIVLQGPLPPPGGGDTQIDDDPVMPIDDYLIFGLIIGLLIAVLVFKKIKQASVM